MHTYTVSKTTGFGKSIVLYTIGESYCEYNVFIFVTTLQLVVVGEVLLSAILCVTEFNTKRGEYHCFAIHLKEESSIVLGSTTSLVN